MQNASLASSAWVFIIIDVVGNTQTDRRQTRQTGREEEWNKEWSDI